MKNKNAQTVLNEFKEFVRYEKPRHLHTDEGSEFTNKEFQSFLVTRGIKFVTVSSERKASIAERVIRTLRERLSRYYTSTFNTKWLNVIDDIVDSYNNTVHSSIKMTPTQARDPEKEKDVRFNLYGSHDMSSVRKKNFSNKDVHVQLRVGGHVRILNTAKTFVKSYIRQFSDEIFIIKSIRQTKPASYYLTDHLGEPLKGYFDDHELSRVSKEGDYNPKT